MAKIAPQFPSIWHLCFKFCFSVFKCPFCSSSGKETIAAVLKNCDKSAVYEACQEKDPICEVIIREHDSGVVDVQRWCSTKKQQTARKEFCRKFGICPKTAYCTESGCKATLPWIQKVLVHAQSLFILSIFDRLHSAIDRNRENIDKELRSNWDWNWLQPLNYISILIFRL